MAHNNNNSSVNAQKKETLQNVMNCIEGCVKDHGLGDTDVLNDIANIVSAELGINHGGGKRKNIKSRKTRKQRSQRKQRKTRSQRK